MAQVALLLDSFIQMNDPIAPDPHRIDGNVIKQYNAMPVRANDSRTVYLLYAT